MGQCHCLERPKKVASSKKKTSSSLSLIENSSNNKKKNSPGNKQKLENPHSSGSGSTNNSNKQLLKSDENGSPKKNLPDAKDSEGSESNEELIDLSSFSENIGEFIGFYHEHYDKLSNNPHLHNALAKRIHNKLKEQYASFPYESVHEFLIILPEMLESLETLTSLAIDGDISPANDFVREFKPRMQNFFEYPSPNNQKTKPSNKRESFSVKLNKPISPLADNAETVPLTDEDGIEIDINEQDEDVLEEEHKTPHIVVTKPSGLNINTNSKSKPKPHILHNINQEIKQNKTNGTPPPQEQEEISASPLAHDVNETEDNNTGYNHNEEEQTLQLLRTKSTSSNVSVADSDSDIDNDKVHTPLKQQENEEYNYNIDDIDDQDVNDKTNGPSFKKLAQVDLDEEDKQEASNDDDDAADSIVQQIDDNEEDNEEIDQSIQTNTEFSMIKNEEEAEVYLVGIIRALWIEKVEGYIDDTLHEQIDDLFFILSNALETAIGTFREYKVMMESFSLYSRYGLRITLECIRCITLDEPLKHVLERTQSMYDDPYSVLIHFADRCFIGCDFWNEHILTLDNTIKLQLSQRIYSYAMMDVPTPTIDQLKESGSMLRWCTLLLDFMSTVIRFFTRNRHQDLMDYLLILAQHHEKHNVPSTLLSTMGEWLDEVFYHHFEEDIYSTDCSDAIQFIFAFVGEVMSGAYSTPIYDTKTLLIAASDEIITDDEIDDTYDDDMDKPTGKCPVNHNNKSLKTNDPASPTLTKSYSKQLQLHIPQSYKSIVNLIDDKNDDDSFLGGHKSHDSNWTIPKPNSAIHGPQSSTDTYGFGMPTHNLFPASMDNASHLSIDQYPSLSDMITLQSNNSTNSMNSSMKSMTSIKSNPPEQHESRGHKITALQLVTNHNNAMNHNLAASDELPPQNLHPSLKSSMSSPQISYYSFPDPDSNQQLKPPQSSTVYLSNSPLSRLDSPSLSGGHQQNYIAPSLTPNVQSEDDTHSLSNSPRIGPGIGGRAVTFRHDKRHSLTVVNEKKTSLNIPHINSVLTKNNKNSLQHSATFNNRNKRGRHKKRSLSTTDHTFVKYLAPNRDKKKISNTSFRTSSSLLLNKQHEKSWKPMHFLQKIMDLEGKKIIANYAFAPSSPVHGKNHLNENIVDLSIFNHYFEAAQVFWMKYIYSNSKMRNKIGDKLLQLFSQRITDNIRNQISEVFSSHSVSFMEMFSLYFKLVKKYIDKYKLNQFQHQNKKLNANNNIRYEENNKLNSTTSVRRDINGIHSKIINKKNKRHRRNRTFSSKRSSNINTENKDNNVSVAAVADIGALSINTKKITNHHPHNHHNDSQYFVLEMLRIGRKHRSHNIEAKTLKLVAKCLIEVIAKEYPKKFNDKIKRSFTITLKLGIKFMSVEPGGNNNNKQKHTKKKKKKKISFKTDEKDKDKDNDDNDDGDDDTDEPPMGRQLFRAQSAYTYAE